MTTQIISNQKMIKPLTSLRFIFIFLIFLHHFSLGIDGVLFRQGGALGVTFFFILSGFTMTLAYKKNIIEGKLSFWPFFTKKVSKLYPLHVVCFFAAAFLQFITSNISGKELLYAVPNVLLLQSWIPVKSVYFSYNAVSWFASDILFFYAIFPFLIKTIHSISNRWRIISFLFIVIVYLALIRFIPSSYQHALLYINPIFRLLDFTIGILLFDIYEQLSNKNTPLFNNVVMGSMFQCVSILLLVCFVIIVRYIPSTYIYASYYWLPICIVILTFSLFTKGVGYKLLSVNILYKLGGLSFCFFLIHQLVFSYWGCIIGHFNIYLAWPINLIITFIITFLLSVVCEKYIVLKYAK